MAPPALDGADNLASDAGSERERDSEECAQSDGDSPSVTGIGIDAALEPETVDASTVEASEASAPPTIDGADNLASDAGTEREPDSEECAEETLSDGDSPSVTEIGIDVALEPEKVEASTVEVLEASALPTIDGADNLASDDGTEREPDSEEDVEGTLGEAPPGVTGIGIDAALEPEKVEASTVEKFWRLRRSRPSMAPTTSHLTTARSASPDSEEDVEEDAWGSSTGGH